MADGTNISCDDLDASTPNSFQRCTGFAISQRACQRFASITDLDEVAQPL